MLEWAGATFVKLTKIQAWQELVFVLAAISKVESREKASKYILMVWWHFMKECALLCVYSDICHRHVMLHWAINYFIERFGYFLVCSVINVVIINAVKHQKVTKTLNNVINSSMRHKMSVAYVRIYTQQSIFFHKLSLDHQNYNFEAFSRLSMLLIADKTNTNSCQAWILVNFTNVAPAHSSIQYRQICWYHLIEETYSYPHVWQFPEIFISGDFWKV